MKTSWPKRTVTANRKKWTRKIRCSSFIPSGSTGQPKGVVHTQAGYLLYASMTQQLAFDVRDEDVYWCTADIGWVTGHSYVVYGPLCNGFTTIVFEGVPTIRISDGSGPLSRNTTSTISTPLPPRSVRLPRKATSGSICMIFLRCGFWVRSASRSTPKPGGGSGKRSAAAAARSRIPGGRRKTAVI